MDLNSYIELKEAYKKLHAPHQEEIVEQVEAVEEEVLGEEELQENPNTWNNPLGQLSRTATKMFGNAENIKGVKKNEKDIKSREDKVFRDGGGNAKQSELEKQGYTSGQARRATMNQGDRNRAALEKKNKPKSTYDPRPGRGAYDELTKAQNKKKEDPNTAALKSLINDKNKKPVEKEPQTKEPQTKEPQTKEPQTKVPQSKPPQSKPPQSKPPAPKSSSNAAYDKLRKTDPKAAAAAGMAASKKKFGDQLKPKTANPLMKKMGLSKPAKPAAPAPAPKAAPTSGAQAAMKAAPMKSSRLQKALTNVKPLNNSVDMSDFDIIIEHLVESGFAVEEALKVMVNMSAEKREQILEMRHRDAKTGEVTDKPEVGKTYYTDGPRQKSSVALRKEKEAAEKKKTQKEEVESIEENRRAARAAGGYKDDSKKQTDPSKDGFTGISNSIADIMKQNKEIEAADKKKKTRKESDESLMAAYRAVYAPKEDISEEGADKLRDQRQERGGVDGNVRYDKAPKFSKGPKKKDSGMSAFDHVVGELKKKYGEDAIKAKKSEKKKED